MAAQISGIKSPSQKYILKYLQGRWYALHGNWSPFSIDVSLSDVNWNRECILQRDRSEKHFDADKKVLITGGNTSSSQGLYFSFFIDDRQNVAQVLQDG